MGKFSMAMLGGMNYETKQDKKTVHEQPCNVKLRRRPS